MKTEQTLCRENKQRSPKWEQNTIMYSLIVAASESATIICVGSLQGMESGENSYHRKEAKASGFDWGCLSEKLQAN